MASPGHFLGVFVPEGSGGLHLPGKVVFGPDCSLYVAGEFKNGGAEVLRYQGKTGDFVDVFVPPGSGGLAGMRTWSSARMAICTWAPKRGVAARGCSPLRRKDRRVPRYIRPGGGRRAEFRRPPCLRTGRQPLRVALVSDELPRIYKFDGTTGAFLDVFGQDLDRRLRFSHISAIAFGPDGLLYVSLVVSFRFSLEAIFRYDAETGAPLGASSSGGAGRGLLSRVHPQARSDADRRHRGSFRDVACRRVPRRA